MKRMTMALLAAAGVAAAAGTARADWGGLHRSAPAAPAPAGGGEFSSPDTLAGVMGEHSHKAPDRYGLLPGLRKVFRLGHKDECSDCGGKHGKKDRCPGGNCGPFGRGGYADPAAGGYGPSGPGGYGANGYGPPMQGTLVFPHHPFVRSPRDFFMVEPNK